MVSANVTVILNNGWDKVVEKHSPDNECMCVHMYSYVRQPPQSSDMLTNFNFFCIFENVDDSFKV